METVLSNGDNKGLVGNTLQSFPCNLFVDVPRDGNCLLSSVALSYLITCYKVNPVPMTIMDALRKLHGKNEDLDGLMKLVHLLEKIVEEFSKTLKFVFPQREDYKNLVGPLRKHMVSFMRQQESNFSGFIEDNQDFNAYLTKMSLPATWCGQLELQALSDLLGCKITVCHESADRPIIQEPRTADSSSDASINLYLCFKDGNHYSFALSQENNEIDFPNPYYISVAFSDDLSNSSSKKKLNQKENDLFIAPEKNIDIGFEEIAIVVLKALFIGGCIEMAVWGFSPPSLVNVLENYLLKYFNCKTPLIIGPCVGASINLASYFELPKYVIKAANSIKCFSKRANFFGPVEVKSDMVNQENSQLSRRAPFSQF